MILLWIICWAIAGQPVIAGWWLVLLVIVAVLAVAPGRSSK